MKEEFKIPIERTRKAIEQYEHFELTDKEWEIGLFGWRKKHKYHTQKTAKGWLNERETETLVRYFTFPTALIWVSDKSFMIC